MKRPDVGFYDGHKYMVTNVFRIARETIEDQGLIWRPYDLCLCQHETPVTSLDELPRVAIVYPRTAQPDDCANGLRQFAESAREVQLYIPILVTDGTIDTIMDSVGIQENVTYVLPKGICSAYPGSKPFEQSTWLELAKELKSQSVTR